MPSVPIFHIATARELVSRGGGNDAVDQGGFPAYYILGIVIAVSLLIGVVVSLVVRQFRKRAAYRREREERGRTLNVRGLVKVDGGRKRYAFSRSVDHRFRSLTISIVATALSS